MTVKVTKVKNLVFVIPMEALDEKGQFPEHISQVLDAINDFILKIIK
ncbi:MAG: hypothetical protein HYS98_01690 [Deltaproteobacteria bacterium]|nr:hypothetical protein [Deltaproteobacteria bacterium]